METSKTKQPRKLLPSTLKLKQQLATMPELSHYPDRTAEFDMLQSPLLNWLCANPDVRHWLYIQLKRDGLIIFNPETRTWKPNTNPVDSATPTE